MLNLVFLPATEPDDETYGAVPERIVGHGNASIRQVRYPSLVWYNPAVCSEAIAQIRNWGVSPIVLIGFSKSGLGAWNIARAIPELVRATLIFDAPVAREELPTWGTAPFYANDTEWQDDLPLRSVPEFTAAVSGAHRLILIAGPGFRDEMRQLSGALSRVAHDHVFLDRPDTPHHWNSGWIEDALDALKVS